MPGITHCGRCGTSLTLRTTTINVHPPRATPWAKTWRKTWIAKRIRSFRESTRSVRLQWNIGLPETLPSAALILRLVVPGWAQIYAGQQSLGRGLLFGYAFFILGAIVCFGSTASTFLLGMAFACHGMSVYDIFRRSASGIRDQVFRVLLSCGLLAALVYLPAQSFLTRFVDAVVIQENRASLLAGDVLLLRRTTPKIGSVVQYQISEAVVNGRLETGYAANFRIEGARIDRVLAGPGQVIDWDGKRLSVDGQPTTLLPLNPLGARLPFSHTVPADSWLILPSTDFMNGQFVVTPENWRMFSTVRTDQIDGQIIWRSWPWSRMGFVGN